MNCPYCGNVMMHATDGTYEYGWCPFCFAQSPAVKSVNDKKTGEHYTVSIATGKRATIEEAAANCKKEDAR